MTLSTREAAPAVLTQSQKTLKGTGTAATFVSVLATAAWFGIVAGFGEGIGLLLFQRINWRQWARTMHVSKEILWISPVVDLCFFLLIALMVAAIARILPRIPAVRLLAFLLTFLT